MAASEKIRIELQADGTAFINGVKASDAQLSKLSKTVGKSANDFDMLGKAAKATVGIFAGIQIQSFIVGTLEAAKNSKILADSIGVSRIELEKFQAAGKRVGLEADNVGDILKDVGDKIGDLAISGGGAAVDVFDKLGLSINELAGMSPDKALLSIASAMDTANLSANEATFLYESLGNDLSRMSPLLADNAALLRQFGDEAMATGNIVSDMDFQALQHANALIFEANQQMTGLAKGGVVLLAEGFIGLRGIVLEAWGGAVDFVNSSALSVLKTARGFLDWIPDASNILGDLDAAIANFESAGSKATEVESQLLDEFRKAMDVTPELTTSTYKYTGSLKDNETKLKATRKAQSDLSKEQEKQIGIINKLTDEYERALNPDKDWEKVDALKGLTGEMYDAGAAIYDQTKALKDQEEQRLAMWELDRQASEEFIENREKELAAIQKQSQASRAFEGAFLSGLSSGGLKGAGQSLIDFMGSDRAGDFSFASLGGDYGLGGLGGSIDSLVSSIGGMQSAASYLQGGVELLSGSSRGFMSGAGTLVGTYFGGPIGGQIGSFVGGALNDMGIGGSGPYSTENFFARGTLQDYVVGETAKNNKRSSENVLTATNLGVHDIGALLASGGSGAQVVRYAQGIDETLANFRDGLNQQADAIGAVFGQDLGESFRANFNPELALQGKENFEQQLSQWIADTTNDAMNSIGGMVDTRGFDNLEMLLFDISEQAGFSTDIMTGAAVSISNLGQSFRYLDFDTQLITQSLLTAAGGFDALQSDLNFFNEQFIPETERNAKNLELATAELSEAMAELNATMPATRAEFRALVEGITNDVQLATALEAASAADIIFDAQEEAAKQTAEAVIAPIDRITQSYASAADEQQRAYEQAEQAQQRYIESLLDGADSLQDWIYSKLTGGDTSATFQERFSIAQSEFDRLIGMGSAASAGDITRAADVLLGLNREGFGASARGRELEASVLSQVAGISGQLQGAAGMPSMPLALPPAVTVNNDNSSLIGMLQQLLNETQAGNDANVASLNKIQRALPIAVARA